MRIVMALIVVATTVFYRARLELPGWLEMARGRHIRALRRSQARQGR